jgi:hypothetical protein
MNKRLYKLASHIDKSTFDQIEHKLHFNLALLNLHCHRPIDAKRALDKVYDNYAHKNIKADKMNQLGHMYMVLGFWFKRIGKPHRAIACFEAACEFLYQSKDIDRLCQILFLLAIHAKYDKNNTARCLQYTHEIINNMAKLQDELTRGKSNVILPTDRLF